MIRLIIVDDDAEVRELMQIYLRKYPDAEVVGLASCGEEAIRLTREQRPDMVLLDISMPGIDGFGYIEAVNELQIFPGIIFITAFENFALKAIKNEAFDYLLKPISKPELFNTLDRFKKFKQRNSQPDYKELIQILARSKPGRIRLNTRTGFFFVDPDEVAYFEADGNYSHIRLLSGKNEISSMNLGHLEKMLENSNFFRVSRSYLINLKYLVRVDRKESICEMEYNGFTQQIKIPAQKIKLLEEYF